MSTMTQEQRDRRNAKRREWYANRTPEQVEKSREQQKAYRATDAGKDANRRAHAKWVDKNRDHLLDYQAEYYARKKQERDSMRANQAQAEG